MDDCGDDSKYPSKTRSVNDKQNHGSSLRSRLPLHSDLHSRTTNHRFSGNEEESEEKGGFNGVKIIGKDNYDDDDDSDEDIDSDDDVDDVDIDDADDDGNVAISRHQKKRKLNDLISKYEFAPRLPDWTDHETFALLDAWGDLFIKRGRKNLDPEEWQEVVEKLSHDTNFNRSETQCRDRLEGLKKKYKKEKSKLVSEGRIGTSNWVFFKKIDILMYSPLQSKTSLSCGVDSGEYVFMDPKVYLDRANGLDEMRDSPSNSYDDDDNNDDDDDEGILTMSKRDENIGLIADSIVKFSEIYEKVEVSKGKQMAELEKMRMDVQRQVEIQRREILERARIEIARIREGEGDDGDDDDENDVSNEDLSR